MTAPSSNASALKWAWHQAIQIRSRFWVGTLVVSLAAALIASRVPLPKHPTATDNLVATVLGIAGAVVLTVAVSFTWAFIRAPVQQRNALRGEVTALESRIRGLENTPVPVEHGDQLRQIAARLQECIERIRPLDYGRNPATLRRAFREHFPHVQPALDKADEMNAAFDALEQRLQTDAAAAGMTSPPWIPGTFLPLLTTAIQMRAMQGILRTPYNFGWVELDPGSVWIGDSVHGHQEVLHGAVPAEVPKHKADLEDFFRTAEEWPEATAIQRAWDEQATGKEAAISQLATIANTNPITTRCFLCRG